MRLVTCLRRGPRAEADEIALTLRSQSSASETIAQNVEQLVRLNDASAHAVSGMQADVRRLRDLAGRLEQTSASFRI